MLLLWLCFIYNFVGCNERTERKKLISLFALLFCLQEESDSSAQRFSYGTQIHRTSSDISLDKLISLSGHVYKLLSDKNTRDLRIAGQLFDACNVLKENPVDS